MEKDVQQPAPDEPEQTTEKGYEIPVPKKDEVMRFFKKVAKPKKA
jgi:hypothetical protein